MSEPHASFSTPALHLIQNARLPSWVSSADLSWGSDKASHQTVDIHIEHGRVHRITPSADPESATSATSGASAASTASNTAVPGEWVHATKGVWNVQGRLVLPGLVDAHTHLDKTLTLARLGEVKPGLLNAIESMMKDRATWSLEDIEARASAALTWACESGVSHIRSHCDWWEAQKTPLAWGVLNGLAASWSSRLQLDRVNLIPLTLFANLSDAYALGRQVAKANEVHSGARLGGFIHTSNWNPVALKNLLRVAHELGLDVDLHVDEELSPKACGLESIAREALALSFKGRIVCGHTCALAHKTEQEAQAILQAVKDADITLVCLPVTNMILQDAVTGRTPRLRGLTLVKEAQALGICVMVASDNVQDPFCPVGSYDPLEALGLAVPLAQLPDAFDLWSQAICRSDWLSSKHSPRAAKPLSAGAPANLVVFEKASHQGFPSRSHERLRVREGVLID